MRILEAPNNIANQAWILAEGYRALGHEAEVWQYGPNPYEYPNDRLVRFPPAKPGDLWPPIAEALERFDVFHFHFARSLVPRQIGPIPGLWDLPLYRAAGKPMFFTFHGSDVRLRSLHLEINPWSYYRTSDVPCDEDDIAKRLNIIRTYANGMWVSCPIDQPFVPDARFHPRVIEVARWPFVGPVNKDTPVVVHAPSNRSTKGTDYVLRGIERAKERGLRFEFRLLENMTHDQVRASLAEADILIDNLVLGDCGVAGLEAMAMGKTVIAWVEESVQRVMGPVPILNADPNTFADAFASILDDYERRERLGEEGRAFVELNHDAKVVAALLLRSYSHPSTPPPLAWPDWAALSDMRNEERLEEQLRVARVALNRSRKEIVVTGDWRGPITYARTRVRVLARRLVRAGRKAARAPRRVARRLRARGR